MVTNTLYLLTSSELRNRIYDFAVEDKPGRFALRVLRETPNYPHKLRTEKRPWKFFALTQACKQVRAEFRPLWIRDLSVRLLSTYPLGTFVDTSCITPRSPSMRLSCYKSAGITARRTLCASILHPYYDSLRVVLHSA
jgi:hypothetical protein